MTTRASIHQEITAEIRRQLAAGVRPWVRPWTNPGELPGSASSGAAAAPVNPGLPLRDNGVPFGGINVILLWSAAAARGFRLPHWLTYRQAQELGGQVRKGECGVKVVLMKTVEEEASDADGRPAETPEPGSEPTVRRFLRRYTVFNAAQIDGLPDRFHAPPVRPDPAADGYAEVERFFADLGVEVVGSERRGASYDPRLDVVTMPTRPRFAQAADYFATLAHEVVHWTRHPTRLGRNLGRRTWGDKGYAREELVAEIGAAFLCAELGISAAVREDHAQYLAAWIKQLDDDPRAIVEAAGHASAAVNYLTALVRTRRAERTAAGLGQPDAAPRTAAAAPDLPPVPIPAMPTGGAGGAGGQLTLGF